MSDDKSLLELVEENHRLRDQLNKQSREMYRLREDLIRQLAKKRSREMQHGDPCFCVFMGSTLRSIGVNCNQPEDTEKLGLNVPAYDPIEHYTQVRDKWGGLRTPDGR